MNKKSPYKYLKNLNKDQQEFLLNQYRKKWEDSEKSLKKHELAKQIKTIAVSTGEFALKTLAVGGLITLAMVAPKVFTAIEMNRRRSKFNSYYKFDGVDQKLSKWSSNKVLKYEKVEEGRYKVTLTDKGKRLALKYATRNFKLQKEKIWDRKWRIITFDIPKKFSALRDALRSRLKLIGMCALQESVFVYPYDCEEMIEFYASIYGVRNYIVYLLVEDIRSADSSFLSELKNIFNLS